MSEVEVEISCGLCSNSHKQTITLPDGWRQRYKGIGNENGFCPDHQIIADFADAQCPGCVGGWTDCGMWRAFAYSSTRQPITDDDIASLRAGKCPRRTGGTFMIDHGVMENIDLSEEATDEAGSAFADAIEAYVKEYKIPNELTK